MVIAYQNFKEIQKLPDVVDKHKAWLKDYKGKKYSKALEGVDLIKWKNTSYSIGDFETGINKVGELGNRLRIEFDGDEKKAKEYLEQVYKKLKENKWGFIRSSHNGKSDYLWIEFTRDLTTNEKKNFLKWIAPSGSEIDLNFSSPNFCFPVLWAIHWKHSNYREMPIDYFEGEQIDYDKLNIKFVGKVQSETLANGFNYKTFKAGKVFGAKTRGEVFEEIQPLFYDKNGLYWLWNSDKFYWEITDEVDLLNMIETSTGQDVITSKNRSEIINTLKQEGRKHIPKEAKKTWVQFKDKIIDILTGEEFEANHNYFITNPIDWTLSTSEDTPIMDLLFESWVGKEHITELYEVIAFCIVPDYFIHRLFCLIGSGANGKSTYLNLLIKFIGERNITSSSLYLLMSQRFEGSKLLKKLTCLMGETNFNIITNTDFLKKLTGGDLIRAEFKGKNSFDFKNYAKLIVATNSLPPTADKTEGFYRRWKIVDFPNKFEKESDILNSIPEQEYNNLALKCLNIAKRLLVERKFTGDGNFEERKKAYEHKSNPLMSFIKERYEKDINEDTLFSEFYDDLQSYLSERGFRTLSAVAVGKQLKNEGFDIKLQTKGNKNARFILGLKEKELGITGITGITPFATFAYVKTSEQSGNSSNSSNSSFQNYENPIEKSNTLQHTPFQISSVNNNIVENITIKTDINNPLNTDNPNFTCNFRLKVLEEYGLLNNKTGEFDELKPGDLIDLDNYNLEDIQNLIADGVLATT